MTKDIGDIQFENDRYKQESLALATADMLKQLGLQIASQELVDDVPCLFCYLPNQVLEPGEADSVVKDLVAQMDQTYSNVEVRDHSLLPISDEVKYRRILIRETGPNRSYLLEVPWEEDHAFVFVFASEADALQAYSDKEYFSSHDFPHENIAMAVLEIAKSFGLALYRPDDTSIVAEPGDRTFMFAYPPERIIQDQEEIFALAEEFAARVNAAYWNIYAFVGKNEPHDKVSRQERVARAIKGDKPIGIEPAQIQFIELRTAIGITAGGYEKEGYITLAVSELGAKRAFDVWHSLNGLHLGSSNAHSPTRAERLSHIITTKLLGKMRSVKKSKES